MTKRSKVAAAVIIGTLCLIAAAVALINSLNSYFTDPAYARAVTLARSNAQQLKASFEKIPQADDARQRIDAADQLVASFSTGDANWTHVFQTDAGSSASSISFALDAHGTGSNSLFHDQTDVYVRLCLKLAWTAPSGSPQLADTPCPANLQPLAPGPFPAVNSIIKLQG